MSTLTQQMSNDITINGKSFTNNSGMSREHALFAAYHNTLYTGNPPRAGKVSATGIISPLRKVLLAIKYPNQAPKDVADLITSAKGTAMHEGMTRALTAADEGYLCEQRIERDILGWKVSGEFDVLTPDKQIKDLKHVSNYNIKKLDEDRAILDSSWSMEEVLQFTPTYGKYVCQLSIYRYLLSEKHDDILPFGSILFSLNNGSDYGKYKIDSQVTFPLFPNEAVEEFLTNRVELLQQHIDNDTLPLCNDVERGYKPPEYKLERMSPTTGKMRTVSGSKFSDADQFQHYVMTKSKPGDQQVISEASYKLCEYCDQRLVCNQN